jgi:hypothetical protein
MTKSIVAIFSGVIIAVIVVFGVEWIGHSIFPVVDNADYSDPERLANIVMSLPIGALLFVPLAWFLGTFCGCVVAILIARDHALIMASIVGAFILTAAIATLMAIPHPLWLIIVGIGSIIISVIIAGEIGSRLVSRNNSKSI